MNVEASSGESSSGVSLDSDMMGAAMMLVMILGMVMLWEGLKWLVMEINYDGRRARVVDVSDVWRS